MRAASNKPFPVWTLKPFWDRRGSPARLLCEERRTDRSVYSLASQRRLATLTVLSRLTTARIPPCYIGTAETVRRALCGCAAATHCGASRGTVLVGAHRWRCWPISGSWRGAASRVSGWPIMGHRFANGSSALEQASFASVGPNMRTTPAPPGRLTWDRATSRGAAYQTRRWLMREVADPPRSGPVAAHGWEPSSAATLDRGRRAPPIKATGAAVTTAREETRC
jgi:hypothetical protein